MSGLQISSLLQDDQSDKDRNEPRELFQQAFQKCLDEFPSPSKEVSVLTHYGDALIHAAKFLAGLAAQFADDDRLHTTGYNIVDQAYRDSNFCNMSILESARSQKKMVREMVDVVTQLPNHLEEIKTRAIPSIERARPEPARQLVLPDSSSSSAFSTSTGPFSAVASQTSMSTTHAYSDRRSLSPQHFADDEDEMDEEEDEDMAMTQGHEIMGQDKSMSTVNMDSLKHRGKGEYVCPYWRTCQKGGMTKSGHPKIFNRNCMYR
ncbi:hypothetical protein C8034_v001415 [Colletotrichum sidae]|uniref:Uncharacterized protein n=1 Tax=Colletotrichum sidae TaxID=1347389 RepID=A0A4V3I2W5_9PEZI|nr:hypothetical protein C8034_v001415 [Colletotrichum sidae]